MKQPVSAQPQIVGKIGWVATAAGRATQISGTCGRDFLERSGFVSERKRGNNPMGAFVEDGDIERQLRRDAGMKGWVEVRAAESEPGKESDAGDFAQGKVAA